MKKRQHGQRAALALKQRPAIRVAAPANQTTRPSPADQAVAAGVQLHRAGRLSEAEALYRQAITYDPAHADANHLLGLIAHQFGHYDLAVTLVSRAIQAAGDRPHYYLNLGASLQALGRTDMAI